jgi:hypothetical protein
MQDVLEGRHQDTRARSLQRRRSTATTATTTPRTEVVGRDITSAGHPQFTVDDGLAGCSTLVKTTTRLRAAETKESNVIRRSDLRFGVLDGSY